MSFAHREIQPDVDLPVPEHPAFETLRQEILGFGGAESVTNEEKVGLFLVVTDEGTYTPQVLRLRKEVS